MRELRKAAVLGAGAMGSRIAAHFANAGIDCLLLDLPAPDAQTPAERNAIVNNALKGLAKAKPPALFTESAVKHLRAGNFQDDMARLADAEWIVEAVVEKFDIKRGLLEQVDKVRKPGTLVSSNTSGLPIAKLAEGLSEDFRRHWTGTHFFNPPRHMRLLELIKTPDTAPEVVDFLREFCDKRLGKVVVEAKDRPNFIANRIFLFSVMHTLKTMREHGLSVEEVDALTGPLIGRSRMATFRLADFTGIDVCYYVASNLYELVPEDERREVYRPPDFLKRMVDEGMVGDKAGRGFYKRDKAAPGGKLVLDIDSFEYREPKEPAWPSAFEAKSLPEVAERIRTLIHAEDAAGRFTWDTLSELFLYAANRIPEVCDDIVAIDTVMKAGFNWERGIFEIWNRLGVREIAERMQRDGKTLPPLVERVLESPSQAFYVRNQATPTYFDRESGGQKTIPPRPGVIELDRVRAKGAPVDSNPGASIWDLGDGVALLEFHSKANTLDQNVFDMLGKAIDQTEARFDALVIGNEGAHFSMGANLKMVLGMALESRWEELDRSVALLQDLMNRLRLSSKPVVAAIHGRTLGGGCEMALYSDHVQAAAETYIGLVEVGVGLIPAAGGCAESINRATAGRDLQGDLTRPSNVVFERIGMAKVANSAAEAREWRYLSDSDGITMNRDRLLADAKAAALGLHAAEYTPPEDQEILVGGRGVKAALELGAWTMRQAEYGSDHDKLIGDKLAHVLAGGDLSLPSFVSRRYMFNLEREAFLSLAGEKKTQQRIEHTLKTGQPLRN